MTVGWTLITVTGNGQVNLATRIPTRELAEEARCIALNGMSRAELREAEEKLVRDQEEWEAANQWREPKNEGERLLSERRATSGNLESNGEGLVRDLYQHPHLSMWCSYNPKDGEWCTTIAGRYVVKRACEVKHAYIFPDDPEAA
jgi:hypothetical protein